MSALIYWLFGAVFGASACSLVYQFKAKKQQATKDSRAQVELHIERQKALGERMIGDHDNARAWELIATLAVIALILFGTFRGWW